MADEPTTETTNLTETPQSPAPGSTETPQDQASPTSTTLLTADPEGDDAPTGDGQPKVEDTRTDDEKSADAAADAARAELFGAPEADAAYVIEGLPEGTIIDQAALDAITPLARELNLSNAGMSKFAQVYAEKVLPSVTNQVLNGVNADVAATQKAWVTEATTLVQGGALEDGTKIAPDPAFAGKTMKEVQSVAAKAIDRFGGADFRQFCEETGMGNHPALLKFAFLAGSKISEDTGLERGGGQPAIPKTREEKYFPKKQTA